MSGYLGTDDHGDFQRVSFDGVRVFDEKLRRISNRALSTGIIGRSLAFELRCMAIQINPSHQANYFLKQMGLSPVDVSYDDVVGRNWAGDDSTENTKAYYMLTPEQLLIDPTDDGR